MKKILIVIAVVCFSVSIKAQDSDEFTNDTAKLVEVLTEKAFQPVIDQFTSMIPVENKDDFLKELELTFPELYVSMAKIYMEEFTHDEVLALLAFYETPVGKKLAEKSGELAQKGMAAGQSWGMKVQEVLAKYQ